MQLPVHIAKKILQLCQPGESIASSSLKHNVINKMLEDGILQKQQTSKTKATLFISKPASVAAYLHNHFGISDLAAYIASIYATEQSRAGNILVSGNSKLQQVRTFEGFLVNSYQPVPGMLSGNPINIQPASGSFTFIHDYRQFVPDAGVTIVGIENPENFRLIAQQRYLFAHLEPLFVSRYPQSNDLVKWLSMIPNNYLHFGDLDFAGIRIYLSEFKKTLGSRASFFLPPNTELLLQQYGNKALFNRQYNPLQDLTAIAEEPSIQILTDLLIQYKKTLEQEVFILQDF